MDIISQLAHLRRFSGLTEIDLRTVVNAGQVQLYTAGSTLFLEGEPCAGLFVLLTGRVHLCKNGPQGQERIMAVIEPVAPFNAVAALDGGHNTATAVTVQECLTWHMEASAFQSLLRRYPHIALGLLRVLAARTRSLVGQYEDLSFRTVQARTAKMLLDLSDFGQRSIDRHEHTVNELAARIGTVPEPVSRAMRAFRELGLIAMTRQAITVCRPEALAKLAQIEPGVVKGSLLDVFAPLK